MFPYRPMPFLFLCLDAVGHLSLTCRHGVFVIARHNHLRNCFADICQLAGLAPEVEKGCNFGCKDCMHPADVLVPNWSLSCSDLKIIHLLDSTNILEASLISGSTAERREKEKHTKKDDACNARGWSCIPLSS